MRYGAVILAAGIASRMGDFKPLLPMGEESVIQNVVRVLREAGVQQIVVVTGYRKEVLEEHLKNASVMFVHNERFAQTKMFDSVKLGLDGLLNAAHFSGAGLVLYGHTHIARVDYYGGMTVVNPGSSGLGTKPTFALIEVTDEGRVAARIMNIMP